MPAKDHRLFWSIDVLRCIVGIPEILIEKGRNRNFECRLFGVEREQVQKVCYDAAFSSPAAAAAVCLSY